MAISLQPHSIHALPRRAAKLLRKAIRAGDSAALARLRHVYVDTIHRADAELAQRTNLQRCEHVIAKECGFDDWNALTKGHPEFIGQGAESSAVAQGSAGTGSIVAPIHLFSQQAIGPIGPWVEIGTTVDGAQPVLVPSGRPHITLISGHPGSGKTYFAQRRSAIERMPQAGWLGACTIWVSHFVPNLDQVEDPRHLTTEQRRSLIAREAPLEMPLPGTTQRTIILTTPGLLAKRKTQHPNATVMVLGWKPTVMDPNGWLELLGLQLASPRRDWLRIEPIIAKHHRSRSVLEQRLSSAKITTQAPVTHFYPWAVREDAPDLDALCQPGTAILIDLNGPDMVGGDPLRLVSLLAMSLLRQQRDPFLMRRLVVDSTQMCGLVSNSEYFLHLLRLIRKTGMMIDLITQAPDGGLPDRVLALIPIHLAMRAYPSSAKKRTKRSRPSKAKSKLKALSPPSLFMRTLSVEELERERMGLETGEAIIGDGVAEPCRLKIHTQMRLAMDPAKT